MRAKFRIFISTPIRDFETYRQKIRKCTDHFTETNLFEFFYYEDYQHRAESGKTISQVICEKSGISFDAMFVAFRENVGAGTIEEVNFFETDIKWGF